MKKENLSENEPMAKPMDPRVAQGAQVIKRDIGSQDSGELTRRAFDKAADDQSDSIPPVLANALKPYIKVLSDIISTPKYRARFVAMIRQMNLEMGKDGEEAEPMAASKEYNDDAINESIAELRKLAGLNEGLGYAMPSESEDSERVTYSKTKKKGDAQVTISANADSMGELHDVLKLAGITLPKSNDEEPEVDSIEVDHDDEEHHDDSEKIAVLSPGLIPGIKPPCFFRLSAVSSGLKTIAV